MSAISSNELVFVIDSDSGNSFLFKKDLFVQNYNINKLIKLASAIEQISFGVIQGDELVNKEF